MNQKRNRKNSSRAKFSPLVDIVIPTAGRFDMLRKCLHSLEESFSNFPINIIVVENGTSTEEHNENLDLFVEREGFQHKRLTTLVGFPRACNEGARMGKAPLILFLNDDVVLSTDSLNKLVMSMDDPGVGIVGAKLLFPDDSLELNRPAGKVQHVGLACDIRGNIVHPLVGWSSDNPKCCVSRDVLAVTGACLMVRRNIFSKIRGFDESYGAGTYEDVDLCLTVRKAGYRIILDSEALATHYTGATVEKLQAGYPLQANAVIFRSKWANSGFLILDTPTYW